MLITRVGAGGTATHGSMDNGSFGQGTKITIYKVQTIFLHSNAKNRIFFDFFLLLLCLFYYGNTMYQHKKFIFSLMEFAVQLHCRRGKWLVASSN